jgi:phosphatidylserine/phosphatidylglycerophosphate/cardiolipin synthase-like enzyme
MAEENIDALIAGHLHELDKPGVLSVRPGYEVSGGWLTGRRAIVATVQHKHTPPPGDALPDHVDGVPVDVRQASPAKRQQLEDPQAYANDRLPYPDHGAVPEFTDEVTLPSATGITEHVYSAQAAKPAKPNLPYSGPAGFTLAPVSANATITLSASPDSGWPTLKTFIAGTKSSLTVGLYDFTSEHVLKAVEASLAGKQVKFVLDHPSRNPTADQTDEQTAADLAAALGADFEQAWALDRMDPLATAWTFPTAYHIKVAVRDGSAIWLSSGNWNNSNQPDIDPVTTPADADAARHGDRDWHVVIESSALAATFEAYLLNDLEVARAHNVARAASAPTPVAQDMQKTETPPFASFSPASTLTATSTISPLLTPDPGVYVGAVKTLIESATTSLHLQFQYIELPKTASAVSAPFADLVQSVIDRQKAGVDVKVIMSEYETAGYLEQLQAAGLDVVNSVRIQNNVHNKGIVVDGHAVLVSSQNWSTDGTLYNRDAGVIIHNAEAAAYFDSLFEHDWEHLAVQKAASD